MQTFLIVLVWVLNLAISIWNAYACGKAWVQTKHYGGWPRFMVWMGAIMSASGFTWCYLLLLAFVGYKADFLSLNQVEAMISLGYILIIPGVIFSGLMITLDSWARAYRERTLSSFGIAAYNTYAQIHNTYYAIRDFGQAFKGVAKYFSGGSGSNSRDRKEGSTLIVILLVLLALFGGVLTTAAIIHRVAGSEGPVALDKPPAQQQNA